MKSPIASNLITAIVFFGEDFFTESKKVSNINKIISKKNFIKLFIYFLNILFIKIRLIYLIEKHINKKIDLNQI